MTTRAEEVLETDVLDEGGADAAAILNQGRDAAVRGWVVPAIIGSAFLMQTLNATSINNALPADTARELHDRATSAERRHHHVPPGVRGVPADLRLDGRPASAPSRIFMIAMVALR